MRLIYFEHQDEEDWAYDEDPAPEEEVAANFFLKGFQFPNQASPQQVGEEVTTSDSREVNT